MYSLGLGITAITVTETSRSLFLYEGKVSWSTASMSIHNPQAVMLLPAHCFHILMTKPLMSEV